MTPEKFLKNDYPADIVEALLAAYTEIESNYALRRWKASELDAGHFVEAARRMLEAKLFGRATPIGADLPKFNDKELARYENATGHDDAFRFLIPRALRSIYGVRNKRGVGHVGSVSPNEMDATFILYSTKWVLAEFVRQSSGLSVSDTQKTVDAIIERRLSVLWKHNGLTRVVANGIEAREQVLVLLYDENNQHTERLRNTIEYKDKTNFRKVLSRLHSKRLIELAADDVCTLTTKETIEAEDVLRELQEKS